MLPVGDLGLPPLPNPTPHLVEVLDAAVRTDLENLRYAYFVKLLIFTALVFVGLVFEVGEILHDVVGFIRRHKIEAEYEATPALFRREHEPSHRVKMFAAVGWLLIVIGVGGEGVFEGFVSWADSTLQTFNNILLADTQRTSGAANERAAAAFERAAKTEKDAARLEAEAAASLAASKSAQAETKKYESLIAQANEHAAEANRIAESERLARVELEKQLSPRRLTKEQREKLSKLLYVPQGSNIAIASSPFDGEAQDFASDLVEAFKAGNWTVVGMGNLKNGRGVEIATQQVNAFGTPPPDMLPAMTFIRDALSVIGIDCKVAAYPSDDHGVSAVGFEKHVLYLLVYHKPEPELKK